MLENCNTNIYLKQYSKVKNDKQLGKNQNEQPATGEISPTTHL